MTRVHSAWEGDTWRMRVTGHAGYDETGRDIVCSAVSALCCALGAAIAQEPGAEVLAGERGAGEYALTVRVAPESEGARGMIRLCECGLAMIAAAYGDWVKII